MKKIGIMTFHRAINYGAMLQAVALQQAIKRMGYEAELIDYVDKLYDHYEISYQASNIVKTLLKYLLSGKVRLRNKRFEQFLLANADISEQTYSKDTIRNIDEDAYRQFFTGSDQVFNPSIIDYDENYLLGFVHNKNKCNSYAASIGLSELSEMEQKWLGRYIKDYHRILIREKSGQNILNQMGLRNSILVADPTFLLTKDEWEAMEHKIKIPKHYILCYGFQRNEYMENCVNMLSEDRNMLVCVISDRLISDGSLRKQLRGIGPAEWLYLIHSADYIVTNSFHGMVFSFIFQKQVWVADSNDGTFSRMEDFLDEMGCHKRIVKGREQAIIESNIDYALVKPKLEDYVARSRAVLQGIVSKEKDE